MERLSELTHQYQQMREEADAKFAAARFVQALAVARGLIQPTTPAQRTWLDRGHCVDVNKAADVGLDDFATPAGAPISDSILALTRTASIPQRLAGLRTVPFNTKFYVQTAAITAAQIGESKGIPVVRGDWSTTTLTPRRFGAITVATNELMRASPQAFQALVADLARAVGAAESAGFVNPNTAGSVLYGTATFASTGSTLAAIDTDLKHLVELVPAAFRGAATFVCWRYGVVFVAVARHRRRFGLPVDDGDRRHAPRPAGTGHRGDGIRRFAGLPRDRTHRFEPSLL